ncbi:MAG: hypothetical protein COA74_01225 [Gammaproteobacteria bacterium]|nr:MAG: hypothetical protein COA74_01225 [Gammaproteobacteria bacterium]
MITNSTTQLDEKYTFTVQRITALHDLLSCVDKKKVNLFINKIRHTVSSYHLSQQAASNNETIKEYEQFFMRLDDKAHQLARFTTELSSLVNQAPEQLHEEAKNADRAIDNIHGKLVDLCITIDKLSKQKQKFYHDAQATVQDIYYAYCKIFNTIPNCRIFEKGEAIPDDAVVEDLLIPVLEKILLKNAQRCHKLVQTVPK